MFHQNYCKRTLAIVAAVLVLGPLSAGMALAQKKGGGGSGETGGGTIYFENNYIFSTMNSDGNGKTPLSISAGEPSRVLHAGHRWFLQVREIPGNTYPSGPQSFSNTRRELFAVREDGDETLTVQLTDQPDLEMDGAFGRWGFDPVFALDDGIVSWIARRWDLATGAVVDGGIYAGEVQFDPVSGNVVGLAHQPLDPIVSLELVLYDQGGSYFSGDLAPDVGSHDWSPDGLEIVHDRFSWEELWVADAVTGMTARMLATDFANQPTWSPDGTRIAFQSSGGISTIAPNGGSLKLIIKWGPTYSVSAPRWSPTGSHLSYRWWDRQLPGVIDVYRVTASGGGRTNLTKDTGGFPFVIGWR